MKRKTEDNKRSQSKRQSYPPPSSPNLTPPPNFFLSPHTVEGTARDVSFILISPWYVTADNVCARCPVRQTNARGFKEIVRADFARICFREVSEVSIYVLL